MNLSNFIVEFFSTTLETGLVFLVYSYILRCRRPKRDTVIAFLLFYIVSFIITTIANQIQIMSFLAVAIIYVEYSVFSHLTTKEPIRLCALATIFAFLLLHSIDYMYGVLLPVIFDQIKLSSRETFYVTINNKPIYRVLFILIADSSQLLLIRWIHDPMKKLRSLSVRLQLILTSAMILLYIIMSFSLSQILNDSPFTRQIVYLVTYFVILSICILSLLFCIDRQEAQITATENAMISSANRYLSDNQIRLSSLLQKEYKQTHDYIHHLKAIQALTNRPEEAKHYIDSLIGNISRTDEFCKTDDPYVNAVMNVKMAEAKDSQIRINYSFLFRGPLPFDSVDICALLSNQLTNAVQAVSQLTDDSEKWINVSIRQEHEMILFQVENPFEEKNVINSEEKHSYGLRIIRSIAEKYEGTLTTRKINGIYINLAVLQLPEISEND